MISARFRIRTGRRSRDFGRIVRISAFMSLFAYSLLLHPAVAQQVVASPESTLIPIACPDSAQFVSPDAGANVTPGSMVHFETVVATPISFGEPLFADFSAVGLGKSLSLGRSQVSADADRLTAFLDWTVPQLEAGDYEIRLMLSRQSCPTVWARTSIHISAPPSPDIQATCSSSVNGTTVILQASPVLAAELQFSPSEWFFGQAQISKSPGVKELRVLLPVNESQKWRVELAWMSPQGVPEVIQRTFDAARCVLLPAAKKCGCKTMKVYSKAPAVSKYYCWPKPKNPKDTYTFAAFQRNMGRQCSLAMAAPAGTCSAGETVFTCRLGPAATKSPGKTGIPDLLSWAFEVRAELTADTDDPNLCSHGQFARASGSSNFRAAPGHAAADSPARGNYTFPGGGNFDVVTNPEFYPEVNDKDPKKFGADGYDVPSNLCVRTPSLIHWLDIPNAPIIAFRGKPTAGSTQASKSNSFVSYVKGSDPAVDTCWCQFKYDTFYPAGKKPQLVFTKVAGQSCEIVGENP